MAANVAGGRTGRIRYTVSAPDIGRRQHGCPQIRTGLTSEDGVLVGREAAGPNTNPGRDLLVGTGSAGREPAVY